MDIIEAAETFDLNGLESAITNGSDVDALNKFDEAALHILAVSYPEDNYLCAKALLDAGANPNIRNSIGRTPLHIACHNAIEDGESYSEEWAEMDADFIRLLLKAKADPNIQDNYGRSPLHSAASCYQLDALKIRILIASRADPNIQDKEGFTALHCAVNNYLDSNCTKALLKAGANPNIQSKDGSTPLHLVKGMFFICEEIDSEDEEDTALERTMGCLKLLLNAGANPSLRNKNGDLPEDTQENDTASDFLREYRIKIEKKALAKSAGKVKAKPQAPSSTGRGKRL